MFSNEITFVMLPWIFPKGIVESGASNVIFFETFSFLSLFNHILSYGRKPCFWNSRRPHTSVWTAFSGVCAVVPQGCIPKLCITSSLCHHKFGEVNSLSITKIEFINLLALENVMHFLQLYKGIEWWSCNCLSLINLDIICLCSFQ